MNNTTEVQVVDPAPMPVAVRENQPVATSERPRTSQELRVVEVSEALTPAYQKASTLEMTEEEIDAIMAPFADSVVEIRPHDGLIYIPHIFISDRLNQVFRPGKWALMCRRHWLEGSTMYGEYILLIRGCYVGESVGGHPYQPNNPKVNYSDTLESTAAEALRRIAGKRLSCGSQVWNPEYARTWVAKYAVQANGKWSKRPQSEKRVSTPPPEAKSSPQVKSEAKTATSERFPTEITRQWMITQLKADEEGAIRKLVTEYFQKISALMPNETLDELPLRFVPSDKAQLALLTNKLSEFESGAEAEAAFPPHVEPAKGKEKPIEVPRDKPEDAGEPEPWRTFPMPFGKHAGTALEDLEKNYLYGLWANYTVEEEYNGKPKKQETIEKDRLFREMLDAAGDHYQFKVKE